MAEDLTEQSTKNPRVGGSIPSRGTKCGVRASPCQGEGREFSMYHYLHRGVAQMEYFSKVYIVERAQRGDNMEQLLIHKIRIVMIKYLRNSTKK